MLKTNLLFFTFLLLFSCRSDDKVKNIDYSKDGGKLVRVIKQMGEMPADSIQYLPLIGNLAQSKAENDSLEYLIIGKNIENGDNLYVMELSTLVYNHENRVQKIIISVPLDKQFKSLDVSSFEELATNYGSVKWALENWYNHFGGLGNSKFIRWEMVTHN
jgi:hypothetical protein